MPNDTPLTPNDRELLETFASQIAGFIERHRLIEAAQQARLTEESEKLHRALLDSVSHELKTPLAVIGAATDGLDSQLIDAAVPLGRTFLDEIKAGNRRLQRIVNNLLDMTRIETGQLPFHPEWCDVRELLESAVEQLKNELSSERVEISVADALPAARLDVGLMEHVLGNLLMNAVTHSPPDSPVRLTACQENGDLVFTVSDQGSGLQPGEEAKVFEKFYRSRGARSGGVGLGLSIVRGFVHAHQGEVTAANQTAGGVVITIRLPVATAIVSS